MSSTTPHRVRRGIVIGALALGLAGGGGAAVWAASTPSPSAPSQGSAPSHGSQGQGGQGQGSQGKGHAFGRGLALGGLHGEMTVKKSDGTFATVVSQRGTVTEATGTRLTVKSEDGYEHSYALSGDTKIHAAGQKGAALTAGDLKVGDEVAVRAMRSGSTDTAEQVMKGPFPTPGSQNGQNGKGHNGQNGKGHMKHQNGSSPAQPQSPSPSPSATGSVSS
ncbi:hypothetical protein [Sinomonas flava]|uniref:DUF5666 domain-containing protein n=1 Tax=Sinomonas flava TaxID=496857 RepID=A0ABN3BUB8_9MICC